MSSQRVYIMTAVELQVMAASCGMKNLFTFWTGQQYDRVERIRAVCKLLNDGLLVQRDGAIHSASVFDIFGTILRDATQITSIKALGDESPPFCVFYSATLDRFVHITPHESRRETFRLCLANSEEIMEELESNNLLPVASTDGSNFGEFEEASAITCIMDEWNWGSDFEQSGLDKMAVSFFEHQSPSNNHGLETAIVCKPAFSYCIAVHAGEGNWCVPYDAKYISNWLKGLKT